jgi:hypothetical protein
MSKKICKTDKPEKIKKPKYQCKNCGETAIKEKQLCKPSKFKKK